MSFISPPPVAQSYLDVMLDPLRAFLDREDITDIYINRPCEVIVATSARTCERYRIPALDERTLWHLARQLAYRSNQGVSRAHPIVAAEIPGRGRVQIIAPPVAVEGMVIAIRKQVCKNQNLDGLLAAPLLDASGSTASSPFPKYAHADGLVAARLREMVNERRNIIIAGGPGSGKTTLLNALISEIDHHERLVIIEETRELTSHHANRVYLRPIGHSQTNPLTDDGHFLDSVLRLRPDRIIMGEIGVTNACSFLRAFNCGNSGVMAAIHANIPELIGPQMAFLVNHSINMEQDAIKQFIKKTVDYMIFVRDIAKLEILSSHDICEII